MVYIPCIIIRLFDNLAIKRKGNEEKCAVLFHKNEIKTHNINSFLFLEH